jgi:DNA-binding transcriptional MocR family regulator
MAEAIPFTRGVPSADMLPVDDMRRALATAMEREPVVALSYSPGGHKGLRTWIGGHYGAPAERVVCANGSLEAFAFVASVLLDRASSRRVLVEAPTYDRSILILQRAGAEVVGVPVDGDGIDTDALAAELERETPAFLYVIPNFQNPSGATMSLERRKRVLELAEQHDIIVVEDDPYGLLRWAGESHPTLCELDGGTRVMTLSSFTKTVAPGLRIGYVVAPEGLATAVAKYAENTYISPCMVSQAGLAAYCEAGSFEPGVERAKQALKARCDAMVESVRAHFPAEAQMVVPEGGYFLWVDLGPDADTTALAVRAAEAGVPFVKGADFFAGGGGTTSLRLAFSAVPPDKIREGIERLGAVIAAG